MPNCLCFNCLCTVQCTIYVELLLANCLDPFLVNDHTCFNAIKKLTFEAIRGKTEVCNKFLFPISPSLETRTSNQLQELCRGLCLLEVAKEQHNRWEGWPQRQAMAASAAAISLSVPLRSAPQRPLHVAPTSHLCRLWLYLDNIQEATTAGIL